MGFQPVKLSLAASGLSLIPHGAPRSRFRRAAMCKQGRRSNERACRHGSPVLKRRPAPCEGPGESWRQTMNIEKYSERVRGFLQSAQTKALADGNPQFTPEHILKVLLDDEQGMAASLIERAGGNAREARIAN